MDELKDYPWTVSIFKEFENKTCPNCGRELDVKHPVVEEIRVYVNPRYCSNCKYFMVKRTKHSLSYYCMLHERRVHSYVRASTCKDYKKRKVDVTPL